MSGRALPLAIGGRRLEAAWWGAAPDAAPTLVLLHEGLGCVALWRDLPERLAAATGCGVLAYSRAGYGGSDPVPLPRPPTYMHDEARDVLPAVLAAAGIRQAVLIGHSDGASIALLHAGAGSDPRLRGLVLIAPHVFVEPITLAGIAAARQAYDGGTLRAKLARHHRDVDNAFRGWNDAWLDPGFRDWRIDDRIASIRVPILLIQGDADTYGTTAQLDAIAGAARVAVDTMLVAGAGHAPQNSHQDAVLARIARFIAGIGATGQAL